MSSADWFLRDIRQVLGISEQRLPTWRAARLVNISVGDLNHALRFSGLFVAVGQDGVLEIHSSDNQQETKR